MKEYVFDVKMVMTARVHANTLSEARAAVNGLPEMDLKLSRGNVIITGGELDDANGPCCVEINGEPYDDDFLSEDGGKNEEEEDFDDDETEDDEEGDEEGDDEEDDEIDVAEPEDGDKG